MKRKPSRTFLYLAIVMVFLLVIGLIVIGLLVTENKRLSPFELTSAYIVSTNIVEDANALGTVTYQAMQTQTAQMAPTP